MFKRLSSERAKTVKCSSRDPVGYSAGRLNINGTYCVFNTGVNACVNDCVVFDNVALRLVRHYSETAQFDYCPDLNTVEYDSTARRLKVSPVEPSVCVV
jgi:predicted 2-oxoglutarate/Fe(II)-dependent dioxygenase YbiX